jgi:K+-transporting ATPase ATPase C chain
MKNIVSIVRSAATLLLLCTLLLGGVYPVLVMVVTQLAFPDKAHGSLIVKDGKVIGSALLGQEFSKPKYFWSRPSATAPAYNAAASGGSNLSPANPKLLEAVRQRVAELQQAGENKNKIPADLVTASGSGLDPDISATAAEYQVERVAHARGMKESDVRLMVAKYTHHWLGSAYVEVLPLNLALDENK